MINALLVYQVPTEKKLHFVLALKDIIKKMVGVKNACLLAKHALLAIPALVVLMDLIEVGLHVHVKEDFF